MLLVHPPDISPEGSPWPFSSSMVNCLMHLKPLFSLSARGEVRCVRKKSIPCVLGGNILRCSQRWTTWVSTKEQGWESNRLSPWKSSGMAKSLVTQKSEPKEGVKEELWLHRGMLQAHELMHSWLGCKGARALFRWFSRHQQACCVKKNQFPTGWTHWDFLADLFRTHLQNLVLLFR